MGANNNISNFRRHFNYFIERTRIAFKTSKEYKANFYSMLLFDFFALFASMISYSIINSLTSSFLPWSLGDFFLFYCFNLFMWKILWVHNLRQFSETLLDGKVNLALFKPLNPYFQIASDSINGQNIVSAIGLFLIAYGYAFFVLDSSNYFYSILNLFFGTIYFIAFFNFFQSFNFFMKKNDLFTLLMSINSISRKFTPKVFDKLPVAYIFYLAPVSISSYFTIEILHGRFGLYIFYLPFMILTLIIFIIGIYLLWKLGLKKYEAFG